jgi:hypothetical protein
MREVGDLYLRIAAYYSELADNEDTEDANEGDAKLVDAALQLVSEERDETNADRLCRVAQEIDRLDERSLGTNWRQNVRKRPQRNRPRRASRFLSPSN